MDVSVLCVSIDVDMSGFVDAMEEVTAMLIAVAQVFEKVAQDFNKSFSRMTQSGEETKSFFHNLVDFVLTAFGSFDVLKKVIGFVTYLLRRFGIIGEEVTDTELLGWFLDLVGVTAELVEPIGWVILAVTALGVAYEFVFGASSKANDSIQQTSNSAAVLSDSVGNVGKQLEGFNKSFNLKQPIVDNTPGLPSTPQPKKHTGFHKNSKGNWVEDGTLDNGSTSANIIGGTNGSQSADGTTGTQSTYTSQDGANGNQAINDFITNTKQIYEQLKENFPPDKAQIKVNAGALAIHDSTPDSIPDKSKPVDPQMQMVDDGSMARYLKQQKEANEATKESIELNRELQSVATGAFTTLGDALGKMIAGQKGVNPLAALMKQMGDAFKKYAEFLITAGTAMVFASDPAGAAKIGEGIALEAVGSAMGAVKLAQGGIVSGSTFANVGEYAGAAHNPEVVAPLDKLRNMIGAGGDMHYSFEMQGDKMVAALQRVNSSNNFILGTNNQ